MSSKILSLVSREFSGWRLWEAVYILFCTVAITVISVVLGGDVLGIASAIPTPSMLGSKENWHITLALIW